MLLSLISACASIGDAAGASSKAAPAPVTATQNPNRRPLSTVPQIKKLVDSAIDQTGKTTEYDPSYAKLGYPNGDVPLVRGVCADVIVRAFRNAGIDLQTEVHEDMSRHFSAYPNRWGARGPDKNIDHRRVPNLMTLFERGAKSVPIAQNRPTMSPGDVVAWELDNHLLHRSGHRRCRRWFKDVSCRSQHRRGRKVGGRVDELEDNRSLQGIWK
jgi:uncharacterized protein YijF (DUF1287 family)